MEDSLLCSSPDGSDAASAPRGYDSFLLSIDDAVASAAESAVDFTDFLCKD